MGFQSRSSQQALTFVIGAVLFSVMLLAGVPHAAAQDELLFDFGDAPDPTYPTLLASGGAHHAFGVPVFLGVTVDPEPDGQPDPIAVGDDISGTPSDEDGVLFLAPLFPGTIAPVSVTLGGATPPAPPFLNAWVDFNGNGSWVDPGEQVSVDVPLLLGSNPLSIAVPPDAQPGPTFARFRLSTLSGLPFDGPAPDGEVEDYLVEILPPPGQIIIEKSTNPAGVPDVFSFAWNPLLPGADESRSVYNMFYLSDGQQWDSGPMPPGPYMVMEMVPPGWAVTDLACNDPSGGTAIDLETATATIDLASGEIVTCSFVNTGQQRIIVDKVTYPFPDTTLFDFSFFGNVEMRPGDGVVPSFSLSDVSIPWDSGPLAPGSYIIEELQPLPEPWTFDDEASWCTGDNGFDGPTAYVGLNPGDTVVCTFVNVQGAEQSFSKEFVPARIGPGGTSMLVFTIDNSSGNVPLQGMRFRDDLPFGMTLAAPAFFSNSCGGTVIAPDGGPTVELIDGQLGAGQICQVVVNVTASGCGDNSCNNVSGSLYTSTGKSGTASATLTIDNDLPGFSKSFAPSTVLIGGRSTLTFTIDNTANAGDVERLGFVDQLPPGMVVAGPANASTDCRGPAGPPTLIAVPGSSTITLDVNAVPYPEVAAGATCTATVDVIGNAVGLLGNVSGNLLAEFVEAGKATAVLEVTGFETDLGLLKSFIDDPAAPGQTTTLQFTVSNQSRDEAASNITFSDDLEAMLTGVTPVLPSIPDPPCGAGSVLSFAMGQLTLTGASLPPGGSCTFAVELNIPGGSSAGVYPNATTAVSGDVGGTAVVGNAASDDLYVAPYPLLEKTFLEVGTMLPDQPLYPGAAGADVLINFTLTNTSDTFSANDITFLDELTDGSGGVPPDSTSGFLPYPVSVVLPPVPDPPCGGGSSLSLVDLDTDREGLLLEGGFLEPGDSCDFHVTVTIPGGFPPGIYINTTEAPSAEVGEVTFVGFPASDTLTVVSGPSLSKAFVDDPVGPGETTTLEFRLQYSASSVADATGVTFTDDLNATLAGLAAAAGQLPLTGLCAAGDGTLSGSAGDTLLTFTGATLVPGEICTFSLTLDVPAGAASVGSHLNTTSQVAATIAGVGVTSPGAQDTLDVQALAFSKEFLGDPVIAGDTLTLRFTIENLHPTDTATLAAPTAFVDELAEVLPGTIDLVPQLPALNDTCGGTPAVIGSTFSYGGGTVAAGTSCTIDIQVLVPVGSPDGTWQNTTGPLSSSLGTANPAVDDLIVNSTILQLTKEFIDDPVAAGDLVQLEFTLTNLHPVEPVSGIAFTDDLEATLSGLQALGPVINTCGGMAGGFPASLFTYGGGALPPLGSCTILLDLAVPPTAAPGVYPNVTSAPTGWAGIIPSLTAGLAVFGEPASDDLNVTAYELSKAFDGPAVDGGTAVLTFTIANLDDEAAASSLSFFDDLFAVIPGLAATGLPLVDICGPGSVVAGTEILTFSGGNLPPGGVCSFGVTVIVPEETPAGIYPNVTSPLLIEGEPVAPPAAADLVIEDSEIQIEKRTNGFDADLPPGPGLLIDDPVTWTYQVTNASTRDLFSVEVVDDQGVTVSCPQDTLAPGESMTCSASGIVIGGQYANIGTVSALTLDEEPVSRSDPSHYFGQPDIMLLLEKTTNGLDADIAPGPSLPVGSSVLWEYTLTNISGAYLGNVSVIDDQGAVVVCPRDYLTAGGPESTMVCSASGVAEMGQYANLGSAIAAIERDVVFGEEPAAVLVVASDPSHYFGQVLNIEKSTNGEDADSAPGPSISVGDPVMWEYVVTNPGPAAVTGIAVTDDQGVTVSCPLTTLAAGESMTCTAAGSAVGGQYANVGTVTGVLPEGGTVEASDPSHYFGQLISLEKATNGIDADSAPGPEVAVGSMVTWTYLVTNLGSDTITDVAVSDDQLGPISCPKSSLVGGESMTCTATGSAIVGQYENLGSVIATGASGPPLEAADPSHYFGQVLDLEKSTNGFDADTAPGPEILVGAPVTWEYVVTNLGPDPLVEVAVEDDQGVTVVCPRDSLTQAGTPNSTMTCTASGVAQPGQYTNTGIATAVLPLEPERATADEPPGQDFVATDLSHYFGQPLVLEKLTEGIDADSAPGPSVVAGTPVAWEYEVSNLSDQVLTNLLVTDDQGVSVSCPQSTLVAYESIVCTGSGTAQIGQYTNIGTAEAFLDGGRVESSDPSHYFGEGDADLRVEIVDTYDPIEAGELQLYEIEVFNDGPGNALNVMLEHELPSGSYFVGAETVRERGIAPLSNCALAPSGFLVECDLGDLPAGDSTQVVIGVSIDPRFDGSHSSEALASADNGDPDPSNNSPSATTDVVPIRAMVATSRDGVPTLGAISREGDETIALVLTDAAGATNTQYRLFGSGFRAVTLVEVDNFADTLSPEVAVLGFSFGWQTKVFVIDAESRVLLGEHPIADFPLLPTGMIRLPALLADLENGGGEPPIADSLAIVLKDIVDGAVWVSIVDAQTGVIYDQRQIAPSGSKEFPTGVAGVEAGLLQDFTVEEPTAVGVVTKDGSTQEILVHVVDRFGPTATWSLRPGAFPIDLASVDDFGGGFSDELVPLLREVDTGELLALVLDAGDGSIVSTVTFDPALLAVSMRGIPGFADTPAWELAVTGRLLDDLAVPVRDASSGLLLSTLSDTAGAPIVPLETVYHDSFAGGPAPEVSVLFETLGNPAMIDVFDAAGGAALFSFLVP